jgi:hypothetical protein
LTAELRPDVARVNKTTVQTLPPNGSLSVNGGSAFRKRRIREGIGDGAVCPYDFGTHCAGIQGIGDSTSISCSVALLILSTHFLENKLAVWRGDKEQSGNQEASIGALMS